MLRDKQFLHTGHRVQKPSLQLTGEWHDLLDTACQHQQTIRRPYTVDLLDQQTLGCDLQDMRGLHPARVRLLLDGHHGPAHPEKLVWPTHEPEPLRAQRGHPEVRVVSSDEATSVDAQALPLSAAPPSQEQGERGKHGEQSKKGHGSRTAAK